MLKYNIKPKIYTFRVIIETNQIILFIKLGGVVWNGF